jgi:anti-anti-sigma factor
MQGFGLIIDELGPGTVRIALHGELDLAHAYTFDEELRQVEADGPVCVVLDLRELTFLDSCGLSRLLAARRRARRAGHRLLLVRGPAAIQRVFAICAVDETFEMVSEPWEVLAAR